MKTSCFRLSAIFVAVVFSVVSFCSAGTQYIVTDLGSLGGNRSAAYDINNSGQIVGSIDYGDAFLYSGSYMQYLDTLGGTFIAPNAINDKGQIVGTSTTSVGKSRAFFYNGSGPIQNLGTLGGNWSNALGINNSEEIVGMSATSAGNNRAFLFNDSGNMQDLGTLGVNNSYTNSCAWDINNNGQIVGWSDTNTGTHAFLYNGSGSMQDLGTFGGTSSIATAINDKGQIVGTSTTNTGTHAFLYSGSSSIQNLGTLGGTYSGAESINNSGQIVGWSEISVNNRHAFLYNGSGPIQDLNNLVVSSSGWTLTEANAINDKGQIVGAGINSAGKNHAFLLTPVEKSPVERLAKWDGSDWVTVNSGDLSSGNIHVLVHGWGPGLRNFADNGGKIWDSVDPKTGEATNQEGYNDYTLVAQSMKHVSHGDIVVLFNWLDMSATDTILDPWNSRNNTDEAAIELVSALKSACNFSGDFDGELQLLGISHGARVVALAAEKLYNKGEPGSVVVDQLTFGDSPEFGSEISGGANELDKVLPNINIGRSPGTTFVDNYYSYLGSSYTVDSDIVNVKLNPDPDMFFWDKHGYPLGWYSGANIFTNNVALNWSPLEGNVYKTLGSSYEQDWIKADGTLDWSREYILKGIAIPEPSSLCLLCAATIFVATAMLFRQKSAHA